MELYRGFGWTEPVFCHLPLLRNADRSKISKRKNPVSLNFYRRAGFLPEAMLNYLALMGWAMPDEKEEFSLEEFIDAFTLERISLGGPVFDVEKLKWLNGKYLRRLAPRELLERLRVQLLSEDHLLEVLPLVQERIDTLEGFFEYASFFFVGEVPYDEAALEGHGPEGPDGRRHREGPAVPPRGGGRPGPRLASRDRRGGDPPLRGESRLGRERALHGRARGHDRAGRLAAPLRDPRGARQGDLPAPPAPRRRRPEDRSRCQMSSDTPAGGERERADFVREIVAEDLRTGKHATVVTRFPPEPNGYLHIGHAKSICLNFGIAREFGGRCHLRFDDTNPTKEEQEYIDAIEADVRWLGFDWGEHLYHASDYFEQLYEWAVHLVRAGKAYVDDLSADEIREHRGTLTEPGRNSPWRDRPVEENLDLFARMRQGEFPDGARVLRAKIDMASGNINLRDPVLYRILHATHPRTGDAWCVYPTYDFAHGQSDAIEGITHSICTLEFEDHRPLYDWFIENLPVPSRPRQYEFARLNLSYTVLSKRFLLKLVNDGRVRGWDDPRMPTISGIRRRGLPGGGHPGLRAHCIGVARNNGVVDVAMLEHCVRDVLNRKAARRFAVLRPLKVVIENYPEGQVEELDAVNNPEDPSAGTRKVRFSRELYIEREDFMEDPPKKFFRLAPGREVRLRYAYFVTCREVVKDAAGEVVELRCTYDPATRGGDAPDGRRPKATLHWVSAAHAVPAEARVYEHLFTRPDPGADGDLLADLNPGSEEVIAGCLVEPGLAEATVGETIQFERLGYFCADPDSKPGPPGLQPDPHPEGHLGQDPGQGQQDT